MAAQLTAINVTRGVSLTECARVAENAWTRLVGLLRDRALAQGDGLWIELHGTIHKPSPSASIASRSSPTIRVEGVSATRTQWARLVPRVRLSAVKEPVIVVPDA